MARRVYFLCTPISNQQLQWLLEALRSSFATGQICILHGNLETYQQLAQSVKQELPGAELVQCSEISPKHLIESSKEFIVIDNWEVLLDCVEQIHSSLPLSQLVKDQFGVMLNIKDRQLDFESPTFIKTSMQVQNYNKRVLRTVSKIKNASNFVADAIGDLDFGTLESKIERTIKKSIQIAALIDKNPKKPEFLIQPIIREPRFLTENLVALSLKLKEDREKNIFFIENTTLFHFSNIILRELSSETNLFLSELKPQEKLRIKKFTLFDLLEERGIKLFQYCIYYNSVKVSNTCEQGICDLVVKKDKLLIKNLTSNKIQCTLNLSHNNQVIKSEHLTLIAIRTIKQDIANYPRPLSAELKLQDNFQQRISPIIIIP